jgi:hypothetical protein
MTDLGDRLVDTLLGPSVEGDLRAFGGNLAMARPMPPDDAVTKASLLFSPRSIDLPHVSSSCEREHSA